MEPLSAATVTAPALEMQALGIVADEQIVALFFIRDVDRIRCGRAAHMRLAAVMEIGPLRLGRRRQGR
jgi:hypothetical protein